MSPAFRKSKAGFSLLELLVTVAIMSILVTAVSVVLRSSQITWEGHSSDQQRLQAGHAVVRHLVRQIRQGEQVISISAPTIREGAITVQLTNGSRGTWVLRGGQVRFATPSTAGLLAEGISELYFFGYEADGTTQTSVAADIRSVRIHVRVQLARGANADQLISSTVWLRSW